MINIDVLDWKTHIAELNSKGYSRINGVLSETDCRRQIEDYGKHELYRSTIVMERYRFGKGEYRYFNYPLPAILQQLREQFYAKLYPLANQWARLLKLNIEYPPTLQELLAACEKKNQKRPTPLILQYQTGGYNTLHQDLYGEVYFPFQVVIVLTADHQGGELVFVEQVPRAQSKADVVSPRQGDAVIFTTNFRPVNGTRGYYRTTMKHGVSQVTEGRRFALGIIFHDAS